jgi:hypothetical protein
MAFRKAIMWQMQISDHRSKALMALMSLAIAIPGLHLSLEDSEIWGIASSRRIIDDFSTITSAHIKPLFSAVMGVLVKVAPTDWSALIYARVLAAGFTALGIFCLLSLLFQSTRSTRQLLAGWTLVGLSLSMPVVMLHFPKARSDSMAVSVCLMFLLAMSMLPAKRILFVSGAITVMLITPKSIDLVACMAVFSLLLSPSNSHPMPLLKLLGWILSPVAMLFALGFAFSREPMVAALTYWIDSYRESPFTSYEHWWPLNMAVKSAWVASLALCSGAGASLYFFLRKVRRANLDELEKAFIISGLMVLIFVFLHSQKYPFFLASRLPFLLMLAIPGWIRLLGPLLERISAARATLWALAIVLSSFSLSVGRIQRNELFELELQAKAHGELKRFLRDSHNARHWDAIGLFPKSNQIFHYPSPGDSRNQDLLGFVETNRPAIVIRTSKMNLLEPNLFMWLQKNYVLLDHEIYVRAGYLFRDRSKKNCELSGESILQVASSAGLKQQNLILVVKTKANPTWNQIPFRARDRQQFNVLHESTPNFNFTFIGCTDELTSYAVTEAGPWQARPVFYNSTLFGYDGRL